MSQNHAKKSSQKARNKAARLYAVQAFYQMTANDQDADQVIQDFKDNRLEEKMDDQEMVFPDGTLFTNIVRGAADHGEQIEPVLNTILNSKNVSSEEKPKLLHDLLMRSILMCGGYELMAHQDVDGPVIINDYVDVAHAFFSGQESKLINGVLDSAFRAFRDGIEK